MIFLVIVLLEQQGFLHQCVWRDFLIVRDRDVGASGVSRTESRDNTKYHTLYSQPHNKELMIQNVRSTEELQ